MYRNVHTQFWNDPKVKNLSRDAKFLFLYLFTNRHTHISGIYSLPIPYIEHETGMNRNEIQKALTELSVSNVAKYDPEKEIVFVVNMFYHQGAGGSKIIASTAKHLPTLHNSKLIKDFLNRYNNITIPYRYPLDTLTDPDPVIYIGNTKSSNIGNSKSSPKELELIPKEEDPIPFQKILDRLNAKTEKNFKLTDNFKKLVRARWNEGQREEDFYAVIEKKTAHWKGTKEEVYLRPDTLFSNKFDGYRNQPEKISDPKSVMHVSDAPKKGGVQW